MSQAGRAAVIEELRGTPYRVVRSAVLAAHRLEQHDRPACIRAWFSDATLHYTLRGIAAEADLLSYLYFDRCCPEHLIELGRSDAEAHRDELVAFFADGT